MADLELMDALTDAPPQIEPDIKRDFISSLEAEPYDDVIGEKCDKTDYIPLLDDDEADGPGEKRSAEGSHPSVVENGEHNMADIGVSDPFGSAGDEDVLTDFLLPPEVQICPAFPGSTEAAFNEGWLTDSYSKSGDTDTQSADASEKTSATFGETPSDESDKNSFQVHQSDTTSHIWQPTKEEKIALSPYSPEHEGLKSEEFDEASCTESQLLPGLGSTYLEPQDEDEFPNPYSYDQEITSTSTETPNPTTGNNVQESSQDEAVPVLQSVECDQSKEELGAEQVTPQTSIEPPPSPAAQSSADTPVSPVELIHKNTPVSAANQFPAEILGEFHEEASPAFPAALDLENNAPASPASLDPETESPASPAAIDLEKECPASPVALDPETESPASPASLYLEKESPASPAAINLKKESLLSPAALYFDKESPASPAALYLEKESPGSPAALYLEKESPGSPAALYLEKESPASPAALYLEKESPASPAALYLEKESPASPAALYLEKESPASPAALDLETESPASPAAINLEKESPASPAALDLGAEAVTSPVALVQLEEVPASPFVLAEEPLIPVSPVALVQEAAAPSSPIALIQEEVSASPVALVQEAEAPTSPVALVQEAEVATSPVGLVLEAEVPASPVALVQESATQASLNALTKDVEAPASPAALNEELETPSPLTASVQEELASPTEGSHQPEAPPVRDDLQHLGDQVPLKQSSSKTSDRRPGRVKTALAPVSDTLLESGLASPNPQSPSAQPGDSESLASRAKALHIKAHDMMESRREAAREVGDPDGVQTSLKKKKKKPKQRKTFASKEMEFEEDALTRTGSEALYTSAGQMGHVEPLTRQDHLFEKPLGIAKRETRSAANGSLPATNLAVAKSTPESSAEREGDLTLCSPEKLMAAPRNIDSPSIRPFKAPPGDQVDKSFFDAPPSLMGESGKPDAPVEAIFGIADTDVRKCPYLHPEMLLSTSEKTPKVSSRRDEGKESASEHFADAGAGTVKWDKPKKRDKRVGSYSRGGHVKDPKHWQKGLDDLEPEVSAGIIPMGLPLNPEQERSPLVIPLDDLQKQREQKIKGKNVNKTVRTDTTEPLAVGCGYGLDLKEVSRDLLVSEEEIWGPYNDVLLPSNERDSSAGSLPPRHPVSTEGIYKEDVPCKPLSLTDTVLGLVMGSVEPKISLLNPESESEGVLTDPTQGTRTDTVLDSKVSTPEVKPDTSNEGKGHVPESGSVTVLSSKESLLEHRCNTVLDGKPANPESSPSPTLACSEPIPAVVQGSEKPGKLLGGIECVPKSKPDRVLDSKESISETKPLTVLEDKGTKADTTLDGKELLLDGKSVLTSNKPDAEPSHKAPKNEACIVLDSNKPALEGKADAEPSHKAPENEACIVLDSNKPAPEGKADAEPSHKAPENEACIVLDINKPAPEGKADAEPSHKAPENEACIVLDSNKPAPEGKADAEPSHKAPENEACIVLDINKPAPEGKADAEPSHKAPENEACIVLDSRKPAPEGKADAEPSHKAPENEACIVLDSNKPAPEGKADAEPSHKATENEACIVLDSNKSALEGKADAEPSHKAPENEACIVLDSSKPAPEGKADAELSHKAPENEACIVLDINKPAPEGKADAEPSHKATENEACIVLDSNKSALEGKADAEPSHKAPENEACIVLDSSKPAPEGKADAEPSHKAPENEACTVLESKEPILKSMPATYGKLSTPKKKSRTVPRNRERTPENKHSTVPDSREPEKVLGLDASAPENKPASVLADKEALPGSELSSVLGNRDLTPEGKENIDLDGKDLHPESKPGAALDDKVLVEENKPVDVEDRKSLNVEDEPHLVLDMDSKVIIPENKPGTEHVPENQSATIPESKDLFLEPNFSSSPAMVSRSEPIIQTGQPLSRPKKVQDFEDISCERQVKSKKGKVKSKSSNAKGWFDAGDRGLQVSALSLQPNDHPLEAIVSSSKKAERGSLKRHHSSGQKGSPVLVDARQLMGNEGLVRHDHVEDSTSHAVVPPLLDLTAKEQKAKELPQRLDPVEADFSFLSSDVKCDQPEGETPLLKGLSKDILTLTGETPQDKLELKSDIILEPSLNLTLHLPESSGAGEILGAQDQVVLQEKLSDFPVSPEEELRFGHTSDIVVIENLQSEVSEPLISCSFTPPQLLDEEFNIQGVAIEPTTPKLDASNETSRKIEEFPENVLNVSTDVVLNVPGSDYGCKAVRQETEAKILTTSPKALTGEAPRATSKTKVKSSAPGLKEHLPIEKAPQKSKTEEKSKAPEALKGYMRPTKARGAAHPSASPPLSRAAGLAVEKSKRPEKGKLEAVAATEDPRTGSDITAPPTKELPASPEKKVKASAATATKTAATPKGKPLAAPSPKKPLSSTPIQAKKASSPAPAAANNTATPKRPLGSALKTATPKEAKPKSLDLKSPVNTTDKKPLTSATTPRSAVKASPAASKLGTSTAANTTGTSAPKLNATPKRPTSLKNDVKAAEAKKTTSTRSPTELSRPKTVPADLTKSNGPAPVSPSRPKTSKPAASKPVTGPSASADAKKQPITRPAPLSKTSTAPASKPSSALAASRPSAAPKQPRPATAPDLKNVRSKIGSTDNLKHQPGGGKVKVEKKPVPVSTVRKPAPAPAATKAASAKPADPKETAQKQSNGKVQIVNKKVNYSHVQSKCGSKDNIKHVPGGGNVTSAAKPSIGSSRPPASTSHKPGGSNVQILNKKVDVSKVSSKCGSKPGLKAKAGAADAKSESSKKTETEKKEPQENIKENGGEPITPPQDTDIVTPTDNTAVDTRENGIPEMPPVDSSNQRDIQSFNSLIPETSI
ncbi:titin-like isoform X2 [Bufo gargarizans]|uniref:titin-like isoform X2 n=1 Tax=Bufo gargarizans TaxID=30331 RepID=UPI001CF3FEA3|nr:titin-like isoform X2 [Bufo gargarizans]